MNKCLGFLSSWSSCCSCIPLCRCHLTGALATACGDDTIRVFEEEPHSDPQQPTFTLTVQLARAHAQDVNCVAWNPKEPGLLASCSDDGEMAFWKYQRPEACWGHPYFPAWCSRNSTRKAYAPSANITTGHMIVYIFSVYILVPEDNILPFQKWQILAMRFLPRICKYVSPVLARQDSFVWHLVQNAPTSSR